MKLALLGSTGSIGTQVLEVVSRLSPDRYPVVALAAGRNLTRLAEQVRTLRPRLVAVAGPAEAERLAELLAPPRPQILHGPAGLRACALEAGAERVVNALVGAVGLEPTLAALEAGIDVALANKEALVIGGALVRRALAVGRARLYPIDSEHAALWQLLQGVRLEEVVRVRLTASGGALRDWPPARLASATPQDVLQHPTWSMGPRITVDSATLVNKAFEVIEAHWLFDLPFERIGALGHPQSLIHGLVELVDGAVLAHLSPPDMRLPIQFALTAPHHRPLETAPLDWSRLHLTFWEIPRERYPAFFTVVEAGRTGGTAPAVANAADEVLVARFLAGEIPFPAIAQGLQEVLERHAPQEATRENVWAADRWAREVAASWG